MGTLTVGSGGENATFTELRSTCGAFGLTLALSIAAPDVRKCLGATDTRHIAIDLNAGELVSSSVQPDDATGQCVLAALGGGKLQSLSCAIEADVSRD